MDRFAVYVIRFHPLKLILVYWRFAYRVKSCCVTVLLKKNKLTNRTFNSPIKQLMLPFGRLNNSVNLYYLTDGLLYTFSFSV